MEDQKLSFVESGHLFVTKMTKAFGSVLAKFYYLNQGNIDSYLSVMKVGLRERYVPKTNMLLGHPFATKAETSV